MTIQISYPLEKLENCLHYIYIFVWQHLSGVGWSGSACQLTVVPTTPYCPTLCLPPSSLTCLASVGFECDPCFSLCLVTYRSNLLWLPYQLHFLTFWDILFFQSLNVFCVESAP